MRRAGGIRRGALVVPRDRAVVRDDTVGAQESAAQCAWGHCETVTAPATSAFATAAAGGPQASPLSCSSCGVMPTLAQERARRILRRRANSSGVREPQPRWTSG